MTNNILSFKVLFVLFLASCITKQEEISFNSPDGDIVVTFDLDKNGRPFYQAYYKGDPLIDSSYLGYELKGLRLNEGFTIDARTENTIDETWEQIWGSSVM